MAFIYSIHIPHFYIYDLPTKYPREKFSDPQNTHEKNFVSTKYTREKSWTHEIPTRRNFVPTKYPLEKISTHEILTRKNFGPTKYSHKKILDTRRYDGTRSTMPTEFSILFFDCVILRQLQENCY